MRVSVWVLLTQQTLCAACLLAALGAAAGLGIPGHGRLALASVCGGVLGALGTAAPVSALRYAALAAAAILPMILWRRMPLSLWRRLLMPACMVSALHTGLARTLGAAVPWSLAVPAACGLCVLITRAQGKRAPAQCVTLRVTCAGHTETMTALIDTGNLLRDHVTGLPVVVLSRSAARRLMPLPPEGELYPGMRYLPIKTAAGRSMMLIVRPQGMWLVSGGEARETQAMLGVSPGAEAGYAALAPACLMRGQIAEETRYIGG